MKLLNILQFASPYNTLSYVFQIVLYLQNKPVSLSYFTVL